LPPRTAATTPSSTPQLGYDGHSLKGNTHHEYDDEDLAQQFASDNYAASVPMHGPPCKLQTAVMPQPTATICDRPRCQCLSRAFETSCELFFVFNGTAANSLALAALCQSYHSVICCDSSHVETDECGAPEFFSNGSKLLVAQAWMASSLRFHSRAGHQAPGHPLSQAPRRHHHRTH